MTTPDETTINLWFAKPRPTPPGGCVDPALCPNRVDVTGIDRAEPEYACGCRPGGYEPPATNGEAWR